jgi:hypothetical protein
MILNPFGERPGWRIYQTSNFGFPLINQMTIFVTLAGSAINLADMGKVP